MTPAAALLLGLAGLLAALDWVAVARANKPLEYVCKPGTLLALIGVAASLNPVSGLLRGWFLVALTLSLAGDVFLMLPRDAFLPGLVAFLLGHLAYIAGFLGSGVPLPGVALVLVVLVAPAAILLPPILRGVRRRHPELTAPVGGYVAVISLMLAAALASLKPLAAVGALLFYSSDAMIAWRRFVGERRWMAVAVIVTYHVGQAGLVLSLSSQPLHALTG